MENFEQIYVNKDLKRALVVERDDSPENPILDHDSQLYVPDWCQLTTDDDKILPLSDDDINTQIDELISIPINTITNMLELKSGYDELNKLAIKQGKYFCPLVIIEGSEPDSDNFSVNDYHLINSDALLVINIPADELKEHTIDEELKMQKSSALFNVHALNNYLDGFVYTLRLIDTDTNKVIDNLVNIYPSTPNHFLAKDEIIELAYYNFDFCDMSYDGFKKINWVTGIKKISYQYVPAKAWFCVHIVVIQATIKSEMNNK